MDVENGESRGRSESTNIPGIPRKTAFFGDTYPPGGLKNNYFLNREKRGK